MNWSNAYVRGYVPRGGTVDDIRFPAATGRYLRVNMNKFRGNAYYGYAINEIAIYEATTAFPIRPTGLTAVVASSTQVNLTWKDNASNESGFKVEQQIGTGAWVALSNSANNVVSRSITGLTANTTYSFRLRATNAAGDSAYTNTATVITGIN